MTDTNLAINLAHHERARIMLLLWTLFLNRRLLFVKQRLCSHDTPVQVENGTKKLQNVVVLTRYHVEIV